MKCVSELKRCKNRLPYWNCCLVECAYIQNGMLFFSKYSRENIRKPKPRYKVGDTVILTTEREVTQVGQDCDGTTLYGLDNIGFGWNENQLKLVLTSLK